MRSPWRFTHCSLARHANDAGRPRSKAHSRQLPRCRARVSSGRTSTRTGLASTCGSPSRRSSPSVAGALIPPARSAAVISSPILAVFAVTAAGSRPRRGHVTCSGVFAVAAVTAAGVVFWSTPARWTRSAASVATSLVNSRRRLVLLGRRRRELGGPSVAVTDRGCDRPDPLWAGGPRLAGRCRGGRPRHAGTEVLGQRPLPRRRPESLRGQLAARSAFSGTPRRSAPAGAR